MSFNNLGTNGRTNYSVCLGGSSNSIGGNKRIFNYCNKSSVDLNSALNCTFNTSFFNNAPKLYKIIYNGNGNTSGYPPVDPLSYSPGQKAIILGPGTLKKTNHKFVGWSVSSNNKGNMYTKSDTTIYSPGETYTTSDSDTTMDAEYVVIDYPWSGGAITGIFLWNTNFVSSTAKQYYAKYVTSGCTQVEGGTTSCITTGSGTFTYSSSVPSGTNAVFLFSGNSNPTYAMNNTTTIYNTAYNFFKSSTSPYLIGLCLGGGNSDGEWATGTDGAIYLIYEAVTNKNETYTYTEQYTGNSYTVTGTGTLTSAYNALLFDIEIGGSSPSGGEDFINLFNYIKNGSTSTFATSCSGPCECIIIASIAHSCSNYSSNTIPDSTTTYSVEVCSTLISNPGGYIDYIQTQLYTQNLGTTNEYCANYNILWSSFDTYLQSNPNYTTYGLGTLLPALFSNNLSTSGGTNNAYVPNLYYYQSTGNSTNPPTYTASGWQTISYSIDYGAQDFFQAITETTSTDLGGSVAWINGSI